jgi:DNA helicase-2/ATP-dependent DNA helicase PcrA
MERVAKLIGSSNDMPSASVIKDYLETELSKLPITKEEFVRLHEKGFQALVAYIEHVAPSITKDCKVEFNIKVTLPTGLPDFPEVSLSGNLDRLDFDQEGKVVRVLDYKTGKPKTRNHIEGKTKDSNGDYKRQLVFYALLLSLYEDERYDCREGVLSFVEGDAKGAIHEETFIITDEEIEELKTTIINTTKEIISGDFLLQPCDEKASDYCNYVDSLNKKTD